MPHRKLVLHAEELRARTEEVLAQADAFKDADVQHKMRDVAALYERLAQRIERVLAIETAASTGSSISLRGKSLRIMLDREELAPIDDFRFRKHMPSRAAVVRELLKRGLSAEGFLTAPIYAKSSEHGVVGENA